MKVDSLTLTVNLRRILIWISQIKNPEMTSTPPKQMTVRLPYELFEEDFDKLGTGCIVNGMEVNAFIRLIERITFFYHQLPRRSQ